MNIGIIAHCLTAVLVVLKALEKIDWSWWAVLSPSLAVISLGIFFAILMVVLVATGIARVK